MRQWMLALLIAPMLAGCLTGDADGNAVPPVVGPGYTPPAGVLSEDTFDVLPDLVRYVESTVDGIRLHARIHLPDGEGPWPTIMRLSPYHSHAPAVPGFDSGDAAGGLVGMYVPKGYAVVVADVRGTGNSEGCLEMMGRLERQDAHDLVEWIAQEEWSNGKVAMHGVSYEGTTPHEALVMAPDHLVTVVTVAGVTNQWRNTFMNGVPYMGRFYPITYNAFSAQPPTNVEEGPAWGMNAGGAACGQEDAIGAMRPDVYAKGVYDEYWVDRNQTLFVEQANSGNASILYSQGFVDRAVNPSEAVHWFNELTIPKKGLFHQAGHQYPPRDDYFDMELAWFDYWLKGIDTGIMDTPTVEVQLNTGDVRTGETWPPAETATTRLYLAPSELARDAPADGAESYRFSGSDAAADAFLAPMVGDVAESLTFNSEPLAQDIHMAGSAWMHLLGASDARNTFWLFELYDVAPEGTATWLAEGWMNAHLRDGFDQSSPLTPGEETRFTFRFEPTEYVLAEGHTIRLTLDAPYRIPAPFDEPTTINTVFYGAAGSYLELPILTEPMVWDRPAQIDQP